MTKTTRIVIVIALGITVAAVVALKRVKQSSNASQSGVIVAEAGTIEMLPRLVDLGSDQCRACKMMAPILEKLKKEYAGRLRVEFIDVWKDPDAARTHGVQLIPTQIFFDASGKELYRHEGFLSGNDILSKFKEFGITLTEESK
jgi:thioredoxin 1